MNPGLADPISDEKNFIKDKQSERVSPTIDNDYLARRVDLGYCYYVNVQRALAVDGLTL